MWLDIILILNLIYVLYPIILLGGPTKHEVPERRDTKSLYLAWCSHGNANAALLRQGGLHCRHTLNGVALV